MKKNEARKIAFLDRDGVINKKAAEHRHIETAEDFAFNPGIFEVLMKLKSKGYEFIVVTNQRGVSLNAPSEKILTDIHWKMKTGLLEKGIELLDIFYCPHADNSCDCRKPKDGMLRQATAKYKIDLAQSLFLSDSETDLEMSHKFGIGENILVRADHPEDFFTKKKIRIAFVKFGGLAAGGSEKLAQIIAAYLPKDRFDVDYYYCDAAPYIGNPTYKHLNTDPKRMAFMQEHNISLIKFKVGAKDITTPTHDWVDTNFWEVFDETKYDMIQTSRSGHKEYPFYKIKRTPILDIINLSSGVDNQFNIARVLHIATSNTDKWAKKGGDRSRVVKISLPVEIGTNDYASLRDELGLKGRFIYGMHQRPDENIFSPFPLDGYKKIESNDTAYVMMGGAEAYKKQARESGIKNIHFLPASGDSKQIFSFLSTLDVYAHGRKDGEVNSQAMAEAMYFGLPIVSHVSEVNNGHVENIGNAGVVVNTIEEYTAELLHLKNDRTYYNERSANSKKRFAEHYELMGQIKVFAGIYEDVYRNPFPRPWKRHLTALHYSQNIRVWLACIYLKLKYRNK